MPPALCLPFRRFYMTLLYVMGCQEKSCISYTYKNNNPSKQLFIQVLNCKPVNTFYQLYVMSVKCWLDIVAVTFMPYKTHRLEITIL